MSWIGEQSAIVRCGVLNARFATWSNERCVSVGFQVPRTGTGFFLLFVFRAIRAGAAIGAGVVRWELNS